MGEGLELEGSQFFLFALPKQYWFLSICVEKNFLNVLGLQLEENLLLHSQFRNSNKTAFFNDLEIQCDDLYPNL